MFITLNYGKSTHIQSIDNADLDVPILVSHSGYVIDGQHRVFRAFVEGRVGIKIKRLPEKLPEVALRPSKNE